MDTIVCPKCGTKNSPDAMNCQHCRINLRFAIAYPEQIGSANLESTPQITSPGTTSTLAKVVVIIVMSILALIIGLFGIVILIGVGEGTNNAIYAFIAVSLPFTLLAGFLSWLAPEAQWAVALILP